MSNSPLRTYDCFVGDILALLETARRQAARSANAVLTATYWEIGRRIVEYEQVGKERAEYGKALIERLSSDLTSAFGRGFSPVNLSQMKKFYLLWPPSHILQTASEESPQLAAQGGTGAIFQTVSEKSSFARNVVFFPLPWSAYVRLLAVKNEQARHFYETEALRGGWSVRQLDRQINSQFYERTALSRNKAAMLKKGERAFLIHHLLLCAHSSFAVAR
ncbi:MAG: DUF1016 family protein [Candidatus Abyssobacteria bacterium SURF_17]|uniref:DUF1016 family protein n=1 Tax=Candidatus Abyssobacteria bacterium SURF_17 TaxID=2093361 RepID=A0A419EY74_9BACT|nr:MAG: DUF1016 family protein [Candidatus Abyssubacteria bacterium SURF_17]